MVADRRGLMLVLSSPSGAGKTTLAGRLLASDPDLVLSISVTTRPPRSGEVHGRDYFFHTQPEFEAMRSAGELLEWATVFENCYGTPKAPVLQHLGDGRDVLFDIDVQGAEQLAAVLPDDLVRVFILPPSAATLRNRLEARGLDSPEVIAKRLERAAEEIGHWDSYDYVIVNEHLDASLKQLQAILHAERSRSTRRKGLASFVRKLQSTL